MKEANQLELNEFGKVNMKTFLNIDKNSFSKYIGFMEYYDKSEHSELKVRNTSLGSRHTGSLFGNKTAKDMISIINEVIGYDVLKTKDKSLKLHKNQLVIIMESILKYYHYTRRDDKTYYLNKIKMINLT